MSNDRTFAVIQSPKVSGENRVTILYKTRTDSPKKAARRYARHICNKNTKQGKSSYCKYVVHVLDMAKHKTSDIGALIRVYEVSTYKFAKVKPVDIGGVIIPTKAKRTVRYKSSWRLPISVSPLDKSK